jgi:hypothetical protein
MLEPIFTFFEKLITSFTWKRLVFILSLLGIVAAGFVIFEAYTGHYRLNRIDRATSALEKITELEPRIVNSTDKDIADISEAIQKDLKDYVQRATTPFNLSPTVLKGIAAAVPWLFLALIFVLVSGDGTKGALVGTLIAAPIPILIAAFIPTCPHAWVSYILVPILLCAVPVLAITLVYNARNRRGRTIKGAANG